MDSQHSDPSTPEVPAARGALGGAADEAGAAHRAGIAALIVVHGLRGEGVPWLTSTAAPVRLCLEADAPVDDIVVEFADGSHAFMQAKTSSGLAGPFRDALAQWCRCVEADQCTEGDQLLLVVAEPTGTLRKLAGRLDGYQAGASLTATASQDIKELRTKIASHGLDQTAVERVLRMAAVRFIDARPRGADEGQGAAWLDAAVVQAGHGMAGFRALRAAARDLAATRTPSDFEMWRRWLYRAEIPLVSDPHGLPAARLQAEDDAVAAYRQSLAASADMLPLADLGFGLTSVHVPGLTEGLRATPTGDTADSRNERRPSEQGLADLVRREGRMLLVGRPGAGKSVALGLVAAAWAATTCAPLPVRARLSDLAQQLPGAGPYRLDEHHVARATAGDDRPELAAGLARRMRQGGALLLLDGLDEVQDRRDAVIEAIVALMERLPASTDVVVTSRHSAAPAAAALCLPVFELNKPDDLPQTLDRLLADVAHVKGTQTAGWLAARRAYIERSQELDRALWEVPLLATLTVLLLAERSPQDMPTSRARLLVEIIEASVHRWEARRGSTGVPGFQAALTADVLLDCYDDIAHLVAQGNATWDVAVRAVAGRLRDYWGRPPGEARAAAAGIVDHWDATAGVFVTARHRGQLVARTRLFAEIGEAKWAIRDDSTTLSWVPMAASDPERWESVRLAAGLTPLSARLLCDLALDEGGELLDLALDSLEDSAGLDIERAASIRTAQIERVARLPLTPQLDKIGPLRIPGDSAAAALAVRLAASDLDEEQANRLILQASRLGEQQAAVVKALATVGKAERRGSTLAAAELDVVEGALLSPAQQGEGQPRLAGLDKLVAAALRHLVPAKPHTAAAVAATAYASNINTVAHAEAELDRLGHSEAFRAATPNSYNTTFAKAVDGLTTYDRNEPFTLLTKLTDHLADITSTQAWHLDEAAALIQVLDLERASVGDLSHAVQQAPEIALTLSRAAAAACGIDTSIVVAELNSLRDENPQRPDWWLLAIPSRRMPTPTMGPSSLDPAVLLDAFSTGNDWVGKLALKIALNVGELPTAWRDDLLRMQPRLRATERRRTGILIAYRWPDAPAPTDDPAARSGFALVNAARLTDQGQYTEAVPLLADPDLLVRKEATALLKDLPAEAEAVFTEALKHPAQQWTCLHCDQIVPFGQATCPRSHPRPKPAIG